MISVVMSEIRKSIVSDKATIELHLHLECLLSCLVAKYNSSLFVQGLDLMNVVLSTIPEIGLKPTFFPLCILLLFCQSWASVFLS